MDINQITIEIIEDTRQKKGMRVSKLAERVGLKEGTLRHKLNGVRKFNIEELLNIAGVLDVDLNALSRQVQAAKDVKNKYHQHIDINQIRKKRPSQEEKKK